MAQRTSSLSTIAILFLAAGLAASGVSRIEQRGADAPSAAAGPISESLRAAVERGDVPGVVAMATGRGGVRYQGAFGLAEAAPARPMTVDAIFRIASMTKAVTSVAAMQLVEQKRIGLDDPAEKYLPEFARVQVVESFDAATGAYRVRPAATPPTIRHLLTHTSGLGYDFTSPIVRDFKPRNGDTFAVGPLLFDPGTHWIYGTSTDWVGRLVEAVSGQTLDEYFREHIFTPLGMADTYFNVPEGKQARLVNVGVRGSDGRLAEQPRQPPTTVTRFNGGGGLSSTAADYVAFLQMLLNGGQRDGARILAAETVAMMGRNQIGDVGVGALKTALPQRSNDFSFVADGRDKWGLGFLITADRVPGRRSPGSLSWGGINNTYFWIDQTRGVAGVILMQFLPFADPKALQLADAFERGVYRLIDGP
jgi:CubicO group peptidase (beta-lactamase class C family)